MSKFTLRSSRMMKDMTIVEVSKLLDITTVTWTNYETNKTKIPAVLFLKYCNEIGLDPNDFNLEGEKK